MVERKKLRVCTNKRNRESAHVSARVLGHVVIILFPDKTGPQQKEQNQIESHEDNEIGV